MYRELTSAIAIVAGVAYLLFVVPRYVDYEKTGVQREGVIVSYKSSASGRYRYPIVEVDRDGTPVRLKSESGWLFEWLDVGEHVQVLDLGNSKALVGSPLVRWSDVLLVVATLVVAVWQAPRRQPPNPQEQAAPQ